MTVTAPDGIYSAVTGSRISVNEAPEMTIDEEPYYEVKFELYADKIAGKRVRFGLYGSDSWVDWGDGTVSTANTAQWNIDRRYPADMSGLGTSVSDTRTRYDGNWNPVAYSGTVNVVYMTIYTREIRRIRTAPSDFSATDIRTQFDPIPVADEGLRGNTNRAFYDMRTANPQFEAPKGLLNVLTPIYDYAAYGHYPLGYISQVPSLFSEDSNILRILGDGRPFWRLAFPNKGGGNVAYPGSNTVTYVLEGVDRQSFGRSLGAIDNISLFSLRRAPVDGNVANSGVVYWDYQDVFDLKEQFPKGLDGVKYMESVQLFLGADIFLDREKDLEYLEYLFEDIDESGEAEDHPFYFDAANLEVLVDRWFGIKYLLTGKRRARSTSWQWDELFDAETVVSFLARMRPFTPPLTDANNLRKYLSEGFYYQASYNTFGVLGVFMTEVHLPTLFFTPPLPSSGLDLMGGTCVRAYGTNVRKSKASIVHSIAQWESLGQAVWVTQDHELVESAIYRKVPSGTKIVVGFNDGDDGHVFCRSDFTVDEYGHGSTLTSIADQPALPDGVEYVLGYYGRFMFESQGLRSEVFTPEPSEEIEPDPDAPEDQSHDDFPEDYVPDEGNASIYLPRVQKKTISRDIIDLLPEDEIVVPALPSSVRYIQDFMPLAFRLVDSTGVMTAQFFEFPTVSGGDDWGYAERIVRDDSYDDFVQVTPVGITVEMNDYPELRQVNGWLEGAYSGYWQFSILSEGELRRFIPLPLAEAIVFDESGEIEEPEEPDEEPQEPAEEPDEGEEEKHTLKYRNVFTAAFRDIKVSYNWKNSWRTTNQSQRQVYDLEPGETNDGVRVVQDYIRGLYYSSRRYSLKDFFLRIPRLGTGNMVGAINGSFYGDAAEMAEYLEIPVLSMFPNKDTTYSPVLAQLENQVGSNNPSIRKRGVYKGKGVAARYYTMPGGQVWKRDEANNRWVLEPTEIYPGLIDTEHSLDW